MNVAIAQTLSRHDISAGEKTWEMLLKLAFPIVMTAVGPSITYFIKRAPSPAKYLVASLASMLVGAGAGTIDGFPLSVESAATIGVTSGAVGQRLFLMSPKEGVS